MTKTTQRAPARKPVKPAKPRRAKPAAKAKPSRGTRPCKRKTVRKPEIARRKLVWRGVLIAIQYDPEGCDYSAHLELRVIVPVGAPLPLTESGYRSEYIYPPLVKSAGGLIPYIRQRLEREAGGKVYQRALDRWRQLDLFDVPKS